MRRSAIVAVAVLDIFSPRDLCYNTEDEFNAESAPGFDCEFVPRRDGAARGRNREQGIGTSRSRKPEEGSILDLPQLLQRTARIPLQSGLQEMRLLFELL